MLHGPPLGQRQPLHGAEDTLLQAGVFVLQFRHQLLHLLALGVAVGGTGVKDHGKVVPLGGPPDHALPAVEEGPDLGDARPGQVGDGLEAAEAALVEEGEEEGLHRVVKVVAQGDLLDPFLLKGVVEGAPAHLGAHGAGVFLFSQVKDDVADLGGDEGKGDGDALAVVSEGAEIRGLQALRRP